MKLLVCGFLIFLTSKYLTYFASRFVDSILSGVLADGVENEIVLPDPDTGSGFTRDDIPVKLDTDYPDQGTEDIVVSK